MQSSHSLFKKNFFLASTVVYNKYLLNLTDTQKVNEKIQITAEPEIMERFLTFIQSLVILSNPAMLV